MIPLAGDVIFDPEFVFSDGKKGPKLFVILANIGDDTNNVYVARATSVKKSPKVEGCHLDDFDPVYFLPAGKTFEKDTWIQFDQVLMYEFDRADKLKKRARNKMQLSMATMRSILFCASQSIHINGYTEEALLRQAETFK
jgi:hypothetical protein